MNHTDKARLRAYHREYELQFRSDGQVWARCGVGRPWGVLYTREQAARAVAALRPA